MEINAQYNVAAPNSFPAKAASYQRRRMFKAFVRMTNIKPQHTLLDLGVTSDRSYSHSNYLELWYPYKEKITASGIDNASFLEELYPGLKFVQADGTDLPFQNQEFDYVHSSAVLEHVGNRRRQSEFLREAWRVARRGIFVTTPNRWFPVEFHTVTLFTHWLPAPAFRRLCRARGMDFFASEGNLNLMSGKALKEIAADAGLANAKFACVTLGGWPSNLLLFASRSSLR